MATSEQRQRLRDDIGATEDSLFDYEADDIFAEAGESHADAAAIKAATRVIAIRRLLASSAKLTSYRQNASQESASDVFKHLQWLLGYWEDKLAKAVKAASPSGAARFGRTGQRPSRRKEYPD